MHTWLTPSLTPPPQAASKSPFLQQFSPDIVHELFMRGNIIKTSELPTPLIAEMSPPFTASSPVRLFVVLAGKIDIFRGDMVLKEALLHKAQLSASSLEQFMPHRCSGPESS